MELHNHLLRWRYLSYWLLQNEVDFHQDCWSLVVLSRVIVAKQNKHEWYVGADLRYAKSILLHHDNYSWFSFQNLQNYAHGPALMNPLLNVILAHEGNLTDTDLERLPNSVETVISPTDTELCYLDLRSGGQQVRNQSKIICGEN